MNELTRADLEAVNQLTASVSELLAAQPAAVVGCVLADLTATWIAGHVAEGDQAETDQARLTLLRLQIGMIVRLIPANAERIGTKLAAMPAEGRA